MGKEHNHKRGHKHGESIVSIDLYAYQSKIHHWNPALKVGFSMLLLLFCLFADNLYVSAFVIAITAMITVGLGRLPFRDYLSLLMIPITFLILGSIVIAFQIAPSKTGWFGVDLPFGYLYVTKESVWKVLHLWGKAFGGVSAMYMISLSTPSYEIFAVLRKLKVPPLVIELMNMIYRFIFVLTDTFVKMSNSAQSRLGYCDYRTSLHTFGNIASNLLVVSMKKASNYYDAMESRCYDGELLFLEEEKKAEKQQILFCVGILSLVVAVWMITR